jgi:hypothetical protein
MSSSALSTDPNFAFGVSCARTQATLLNRLGLPLPRAPPTGSGLGYVAQM